MNSFLPIDWTVAQIHSFRSQTNSMLSCLFDSLPFGFTFNLISVQTCSLIQKKLYDRLALLYHNTHIRDWQAFIALWLNSFYCRDTRKSPTQSKNWVPILSKKCLQKVIVCLRHQAVLLGCEGGNKLHPSAGNQACREAHKAVKPGLVGLP